MAVKFLPQYEADEGPLTAAQVRQIRKRAAQGKKQSVRSSLFGLDPVARTGWDLILKSVR